MFCAPVGFQGARGRPGHGQVQPGLRGHRLHGGYTRARGACGCSAPPADRTGVTAVQPPPQQPGMRTSSTEHGRAGTQPMSQRSSDPAGQAGGDWPDDLWPDDDGEGGSSSPAGDGARDGAGDGSPPGVAGAPPVPSGWPGTAPRNRRIRPAVLAVIIVAAAAAGGGIAAAVVHDLSAPSATGSGAAGSGASGSNGPFSL